MLDKASLLTTKQVANFVADGLLIFPEIVPEDINQEAIKVSKAGTTPLVIILSSY